MAEARRRKAKANADIIGRRTNKRVVVIPPGGVLGEYVPFYFFNNLQSIQELDWTTIRSTLWKNTDDDYDRVRKKMAERRAV